MQITLDVPDALGHEIQRNQDRLVEIIERGLEALPSSENDANFTDESPILELLLNQPDPAQVLALKPSPQFQERVSSLLQQSKEYRLTSQGETELNRYLWLEYLVRLAKIHASKKLSS